MNENSIIQYLLSIVIAGLAWWNKTMHEDLKTTKESLAQFKTDVAEKYVPRDDFRDVVKEIREMFTQISNKLDGKADK